MDRKINEHEKVGKNKKMRRQIVGVVVFALCAIGIGSIIFNTFNLGTKLFSNEKEKAKYEDLLAPFVMLDPLPFVSLEEAPQNLLLEASIWYTLYHEDLARFDKDEFGAVILPALDIDVTAAKLYGPDFKLVHGTFSDQGMEFKYLEDEKGYVIPITSQTNSYLPQVVDVKTSGGVKRVTMGYLAPYSGTLSDMAQNKSGGPVKYTDYVLKKGAGAMYYLVAVEESERKVEAKSEPEAQTLKR